MAKVLISSIGTGVRATKTYRTADYKFDNDEAIYTAPFIAGALVEKMDIDQVVFIGTAKSMWGEVYRYFTENGKGILDDEYWFNLSDKAYESNHEEEFVDLEMLGQTMKAVDNFLKIRSPNATGGSLPVLMEYGVNEKEILDNFSLFVELANQLEDGDEIYLDITHAFRSIPLYMYLMINFIKTLQHRNIEVKGIFYGMLEISKEKGYTPIVDVVVLNEISHWIKGTHEFVSYGNGHLISSLMEEEATEECNIRDIANDIKEISEMVNSNYLTGFRSKINNLNSKIDKEDKKEGISQHMLPMIKEFTSIFDGIKKDSVFQLELARWYIENKQYGYGYICMVEGIVSHFCEVYGLCIDNQSEREKIECLFYEYDLFTKSKKLTELKDEYREMNEIREGIAHSAFRVDRDVSFPADENKAAGHYNKVKDLLETRELKELNRIIPMNQILCKVKK